jgi:hypothetical protein
MVSEEKRKQVAIRKMDRKNANAEDASFTVLPKTDLAIKLKPILTTKKYKIK